MTKHLQTSTSCVVLLSMTLALLLGGPTPPTPAAAGKILVFPVDGSHWVNMNLLIAGLHSRGHEITVVRSSTSWYVKEESPHYRSITVELPEKVDIEEEDFYVTFLKKMLEIQEEGASPLAFISFYSEMLPALSNMHRQSSQLVVEMFENPMMMRSLRNDYYDVMLLDPGLPAGVLVAHNLGLPTIFNVRWILSGEGHDVIAPTPISYVPVAGNAVSDKMTFSQRAKNMFHYFFKLCIDHFVVCPHYDQLLQRYFEPGPSFYELLQAADLWLMRVDFVFEFPRPTMPNVVYIGGFQCQRAEPLPSELEKFVQSSGDHGVVVMSLGTLIKGLPSDITSEIAAAFAQLPQKVIWRHPGERPKNLGNNTLIVKWMPQNDLLGHPKVKAFVSHCGTNGIYEAMYHGVPIVGVPLLFDQFENVLRLEVRGAAKWVDVTKLTSQNFLEAIQEVLHKRSYRENMQHLSALHQDKPMHPLDTALYWVEFVMRHRGAAHLRTSSYQMPWYEYHSLDVIGFLLMVILVLTVVTVVLVRYLCCALCRKGKVNPEKDLKKKQ